MSTNADASSSNLSAFENIVSDQLTQTQISYSEFKAAGAECLNLFIFILKNSDHLKRIKKERKMYKKIADKIKEISIRFYFSLLHIIHSQLSLGL